MNLETARNEMRNPSRVTALEMLIEVVVCIAIAAFTVQLIP